MKHVSYSEECDENMESEPLIRYPPKSSVVNPLDILCTVPSSAATAHTAVVLLDPGKTHLYYIPSLFVTSSYDSVYK